MRSGKGWGRAFAAAFIVLAAVQGCAAPRPATKANEPPGLSVRLPVPTGETLAIESPPAEPNPELPLSVADETRGRWLTLFEVNYSPAKSHPPVGEEEPSR